MAEKSEYCLTDDTHERVFFACWNFLFVDVRQLFLFRCHVRLKASFSFVDRFYLAVDKCCFSKYVWDSLWKVDKRERNGVEIFDYDMWDRVEIDRSWNTKMDGMANLLGIKCNSVTRLRRWWCIRMKGLQMRWVKIVICCKYPLLKFHHLIISWIFHSPMIIVHRRLMKIFAKSP